MWLIIMQMMNLNVEILIGMVTRDLHVLVMQIHGRHLWWTFRHLACRLHVVLETLVALCFMKMFFLFLF